MSNGDNGDTSSLKSSTLNRRNMLLGGTPTGPRKARP
jgi:hypothetical protein